MSQTTPDFLNKISDVKERLSPEEQDKMLGVISQGDTLVHNLKGQWFRVVLLEYLVDRDIDRVNKELYPRVKAACIKDDMDAIEKNRVTNFHRSAVSTIRAAIKNNITIIKASTKTGLAKAVSDTRQKVDSTPEDVCNELVTTLTVMLKEGVTPDRAKASALLHVLEERYAA